MNFIEAMQALQQGKRVRCVNWPKGAYMEAPRVPGTVPGVRNPGQLRFKANYIEDCLSQWEIVRKPNLYDKIASAAGCDRETVKRVLRAKQFLTPFNSLSEVADLDNEL